jgi:acetyl-CoA synthetase
MVVVAPVGLIILRFFQSTMSKSTESHLVEDRIFPPPPEFSKTARVKSLADYRKRHAASIKDPQAFWAAEAAELSWQRPWDEVLEWKPPLAKWFKGGKLNVAENCVDRHAANPSRKNKAAIIWEGEPGERRTLTYQQLQREVCRFANVLKAHGVKSKDRVMIYLPMVPEAGPFIV